MNQNIEKFIEDISKEKDFIVFAGTGVVGGTGIDPSWKKLLEKFKEEEPDTIKEKLDEIDELDYPKIAQNIFNSLNEDRYYEIIKAGLSATDAPYSAKETSIVKTAQHVVTTNFDCTFVNAMNFVLEDVKNCSHKVQSLPTLKHNALFNNYSVSYLHGRIDEKHIVFKEDDYKFYYPSQFGNSSGTDNLEKFLRNIYEEHTIVFIGFGFRDKYLLQALQKIREKIERNYAEVKKIMPSHSQYSGKIKHYACLRKFDCKIEERALIKKYPKMEPDEIKNIVEKNMKDDDNLTEVLKEIGIKVMRYEEHKDWMDWFELIRKNRREVQSAKIDSSSFPTNIRN